MYNYKERLFCNRKVNLVNLILTKKSGNPGNNGDFTKITDSRSP